MNEVRLLSKFKSNGNSILTGFSGNEVKEFMRDLQKEITSLQRQIDYRSKLDLPHEIKQREERQAQLRESLDVAKSQIKDWFEPGNTPEGPEAA